ncbi:MAG: AAA family ATPase [Dehalococcoidia bacterium]|nr:AAA family ATPase [Dehalococcoidia bacterium]
MAANRTTTDKHEVQPEKLRWTCDTDRLGFDCTDELSPPTEFIGQDRAVTAVQFGLGVDRPGYNVFVTGLTGTGRTSAVEALLERVIEERTADGQRPEIQDICFVHNFVQPDHPEALVLPMGGGRELCSMISGLRETLRREIESAFTSDEYRGEQKKITDAGQARRQELIQTSEKFATDKSFAIQTSQLGIAVIPVVDGKPMEAGQYQALSDDERQAIDTARKEVSDQVETAMREVQEGERQQAEELAALAQRVGERTIQSPFAELFEKYDALEDLAVFLKGLHDYTLANLEIFQGEQENLERQPATGRYPVSPPANPLLPFEVNLFADHGETESPPIVIERHPTYFNLFGRIERQAVMGTYVTNHTMLRAGSIVSASGGYLVMQARDVVTSPGSWEALKRVLRIGQLQLEDPADFILGLAPQGLRPEPVPVNVKVILTGDMETYQILASADPEFWEVFKVRADFDSQMDATDDHIEAIGSFICGVVTDNGLNHFMGDGVGAVVEYASRMVAEQGKLSTRFGYIKDLVVESSFWAGQDDSTVVLREHVEKALDQRVYRSGLVSDRIQEAMLKGTVMVDLAGDRIGQVNGLAVYQIGDVAFGKPSRITARTYVGQQGVVNIEREAHMSGSTHDKGVLILGGYLGSKFAQEFPLSVAVSIAFEQSYAGVDGDSASSSELYAILSSLSGLPLNQGIAVTGSVNQMGDIQPIGGANEKVEGFFDLCKAAGKTGDVGVMIPHQNIANLTLRPDVVEAVNKEEFHVYAVETINDGVEVLTGVTAGEADARGRYPEGTVNALVSKRLREMAEAMKSFSRS